MFQGMKEDPKTFYLRVTVQARKARYHRDIMTTMVKQTFMNGLHKKIANKIAEQPRLNLANTVELATRIWNHSNQRINQSLTLFPQQAPQEVKKYPIQDETPRIILKRSPQTKAPRQDLETYLRDKITTHTPRQTRDTRDFQDKLDEVIQRIEIFEAHHL